MVVVRVLSDRHEFSNSLTFEYLPETIVSLAPTADSFRVYSHIHIDNISPSQGPASGGTILTVKGGAFAASSSWVCAFGTIRVVARVMSDRHLLCVSPPSSGNHLVPLFIRDDAGGGIGTDSASALTFTFVRGHSIRHLRPSHGPVLGGIVITMSLDVPSVPDDLSSPLCVFGQEGTRVAATFLAPGAVACVAPAKGEGAVAVAVASALSASVSLLPNAAVFYYVEVRVDQATPLNGPVMGQTEVLFTGRYLGVLRNSPLVCKVDGRSAVAMVVLPSRISCKTPGVDVVKVATFALFVDGDTPLRLAHFSFHFFSTPALRSIHPGAAPVHGGSLVTLVARLDFSITVGPYCRFGDSTLLYAAHRMSTTDISCITPAMAVGAHSVALTWNGREFSSAIQMLEVVGTVVVHEVKPSCGPLLGGTRVVLTGGPFGRRTSRLALLRCRIGNGTSVEGTVVDWNQLVCTTPPLADGVPVGM